MRIHFIGVGKMGLPMASHFTVVQMLKDLDLIIGEGGACNVPLVQTAVTRQWMRAAAAQGDALEDYAAVIKTVERSAGLDTYSPFKTKPQT